MNFIDIKMHGTTINNKKYKNYLQEFSSYFTEITFRVHKKDQSVNDVQGIKRRL